MHGRESSGLNVLFDDFFPKCSLSTVSSVHLTECAEASAGLAVRRTLCKNGAMRLMASELTQERHRPWLMEALCLSALRSL